MVGYGDSGPYLIYSYKFTGFSGKPGPKLREFDRQMPEGIYEIESYNPNSKFHLSMRLNYPNGFDKKMAKSDGRDLGKLGGDIMIHGRSGTVVCFPLEDIAIEEVFTICRLAPAQKVKVIVVPHPPDAEARAGAGTPATPESAGVPAWYPRLLDEIAAELERENLSRFLEVPEDGGFPKNGDAGVYLRCVVGIVRGVVRRVFSIPRPKSRLSQNRLARRRVRGLAGSGAQRSRTPQNAEVLPCMPAFQKACAS